MQDQLMGKLLTYDRLRDWLVAGGLVASMLWLSQVSTGAEPATAVQLMKEAHDGRAVWTRFPGFRAQVRATHDGDVVIAKLNVSANGEVKVEPLDGKPFPAWADRTLRSVIGHRLSDDPAIDHVEFADDVTTHPLGRLLKSTDASDKSQWRVQGDLLTEVHRVQEKTRFIISVTEVSRTVEKKHLPRSYTVTTWDVSSNQLVSTRQLYNEWVRVGQIDLPQRVLAITSKSDGSRVTECLDFSGHELLPAIATAGQ